MKIIMDNIENHAHVIHAYTSVEEFIKSVNKEGRYNFRSYEWSDGNNYSAYKNKNSYKVIRWRSDEQK